MDEQKSKKFRLSLKKAGCFMTIFTAVFLCCAATVGLFWAGGWMKETACSSVKENSYIWEKSNCSSDTSEVKTTTDATQGEVIDIQIPQTIQNQEDLVKSIISQASSGVVTVSVSNLAYDPNSGFSDQQSGIGSGFVVDSNGLIITNQHVVSDEASEYSVIVPGEDKATPVVKIYRDRVNDIAILKVDRTDLKALKLGDSDQLERGSTVIAIGNPLGELEGTATSGIVSGLGRDVTAGSGFQGSSTHYEDVIQTDAAINPGNSGGPLLNSKGEVVGINFATTQGADNISFAIPVNKLKTRLDVFKKDGRFPQPYIGISYSQKSFFYKGQLLTGAVIYSTEKGGPAEVAGVLKGDVVLEANGKSLDQTSLSAVIGQTEIGSIIKLHIWRNGETVDIEVVVADKGK